MSSTKKTRIFMSKLAYALTIVIAIAFGDILRSTPEAGHSSESSSRA